MGLCDIDAMSGCSLLVEGQLGIVSDGGTEEKKCSDHYTRA